MWGAVTFCLAAVVVASFFATPLQHAWRGHPPPNKCLMTYMHPTYTPTAVPNATKRYRLLLYKEEMGGGQRPSISKARPV